MKHLVTRPHVLFSTANGLHKKPGDIEVSHEAALNVLNKLGGNNAHSIEGSYGAPEKSIFISEPNEKQLQVVKTLTDKTGQESYIHSDGFNHKMIFTNGPEKGSVKMGRGTEFHAQKPNDFFSQLPDGTTFTHKFDDTQKSEESKKGKFIVSNKKPTAAPVYTPPTPQQQWYKMSWKDKKAKLAQDEYNRKNPQRPIKEDIASVAQEIFGNKKVQKNQKNYLPHDIVEVNPTFFHKKISSFRDLNDMNRANIHPYSPKDYAKMKTYMTRDGKSGYAIKNGNELVSVHSSEKNRGDILVNHAVKMGAKKLDAYDIGGKLTNLYGKFGFKEKNRSKFDSKYSDPSNTILNTHKPDFVEMEIEQPHSVQKMDPLMKPYASEAQRRWAHTKAGTKALGGKEAVKEWDKESRGKKLPEKLDKGVKRRLFPFNPQTHLDPEVDQTQNLRTWTTYDRDGNLTDLQELHDIRDSLPEMDQNARKRGLISLASKTKTRIHPKTGERQYLLHRGMSAQEVNATVGDTHVSHDKMSSWSPNASTAKQFSDPKYITQDHLDSDIKPTKGKRVSAWINESDIHHIPMQYGEIDEYGSPGQGKPEFGDEKEIIVKPHKSEKASLPRQTETQKLHQRINYNPLPSGEYDQKMPPSMASNRAKTRLRQKFGLDYNIEGIKPPKRARKLAASELAKAPIENYDSSIGRDAPEHPMKERYESNATTKEVAPGIYHHALFSNRNQEALHMLSNHQDPFYPKATIYSQLLGDAEKHNGPLTVQLSQVHPEHKGMGHGKALYAFALNHHGEIRSDELVSPLADDVYRHLQSQGAKVKYGEWDTRDRHVVRGPVSHSYSPKKLAASELAKAKEDKLIPASQRKQFRAERSKFEGQDPLAQDPTNKPGVSDIGIETRRADPKQQGVFSHGYARIGDAAYHNLRAKKRHMALLDRLKGMGKSLEKAKDVDWNQYGISHIQSEDGLHHTAIVTTKNKYGGGDIVGEFQFAADHPAAENKLWPLISEVHPEHQRKGLATAAYRFIEEKTGKKIVPSSSQSLEAKKLWSQQNRGFGISPYDKSELNKALSPEEIQSQGYKFKIFPPTKNIDAHVVKAYHNGKKVGHMVFNSRPFSVPDTESMADRSHKNGYHSVLNSEIQEGHRGKGLYQRMIALGSEYVKKLGSKGLMSEGYQRSGDATRAWDKVASHAADEKYSKDKIRGATYFKSELEKSEPPPSKPGQVSEDGKRVAIQLEDGHPVWDFHPQIKQKLDQDTLNMARRWIKTQPEEHHPILKEFINGVLQHPLRHIRFGGNSKTGGQEVRQRHIHKMVTEHPDVKLEVHSPDSLSLFVKRHGATRGITHFQYNLKNKVAKSESVDYNGTYGIYTDSNGNSYRFSNTDGGLLSKSNGDSLGFENGLLQLGGRLEKANLDAVRSLLKSLRQHFSGRDGGNAGNAGSNGTLSSDGTQLLKSGPRENLRGFTTKKLKQLSQDNYHNPDTGTEVDATAVHNELATRADKKGEKLISQYKQSMKAKPKKRDLPEDWFGKNNTHPWEKVWQNMKDHHTGSVDEKSAPHMYQRAQKYKNYELKEVDLGLIGNGEERPHLPLHDETDEKWANNYAKLNTEAPPVTLHPLEGGKYHIVDGRHRARAAALQGKNSILAYVGIPESGLNKSAPKKVKLYHITDKANFKLNPNFAPQDNAIAVQDRSGQKGLYTTQDPERWVNGHGYKRPFIVELEADESLLKDPAVGGRWGGEKFIPSHMYDKVSVNRVIPLDAYAREKYGSHGWIERDAGHEFDTGSKITAKDWETPFKGYKYAGKDVREMSGDEVKRLKQHFKMGTRTNKSEGDLSKGAKGDWKKEAYTMKHTPPKGSGPYSLHTVTAHTHDGKVAGSLSAEDLGDGNFQVHLVEVHPDHRRKGIASAMYQLLEHKTGLKAIPDLEAQSPEGAALWRQKNRKFGKSELSKMSRPRITFPNYPKVTNRPDQQVSLLETGRQKDIYARGAASQHIKDQKDVPYTIMVRNPDGSHNIDYTKKDLSRQADREKVANSIANRFDRTALGLNVNTPTGPRSAALAGKLRSKYEDFDDSHEKRLQEHKEKVAQWRDDYHNKLREWRNKGTEIFNTVNMSTPEGKAAYDAHVANRPEKGKKPRTPAKKRIATKDLSPEQMALRGKTVDSTIEHEGLHHTMDQISRLYGPEEAARAHDTIYNSFDDTVKAALSHYAQKLGYKPSSEHFQEEMMAAARDILVNPKKREGFKKLHGDRADGYLKSLKAQYQKAYEAAKQLKPMSVEDKKLAASEEEKKTK